MSVGIKETQEAIIAGVKVAKVLSAAAKDGLDIKDAVAVGTKFATDAEFRGAIIAGIQDSGKIPEEIKDIDMQEGFELVLAVLAELKKV